MTGTNPEKTFDKTSRSKSRTRTVNESVPTSHGEETAGITFEKSPRKTFEKSPGKTFERSPGKTFEKSSGKTFEKSSSSVPNLIQENRTDTPEVMRNKRRTKSKKSVNSETKIIKHLDTPEKKSSKSINSETKIIKHLGTSLKKSSKINNFETPEPGKSKIGKKSKRNYTVSCTPLVPKNRTEKKRKKKPRSIKVFDQIPLPANVSETTINCMIEKDIFDIPVPQVKSKRSNLSNDHILIQNEINKQLFANNCQDIINNKIASLIEEVNQLIDLKWKIFFGVDEFLKFFPFFALFRNFYKNLVMVAFLGQRKTTATHHQDKDIHISFRHVIEQEM